MSQLPIPLSTYVERFNEQYLKLGLKEIPMEELAQLISKEKAAVNNLFMAGLGASTLILRLGAVVQLSKK